MRFYWPFGGKWLYFLSELLYLLSMKGDIECIHQSFDGSGSIYIGLQPNPKYLEVLERYTIRAVLILSPQSSPIQDYPEKYSTLQLSISKTDKTHLRQNFLSSFQFLNKYRAKTNILICSSIDTNICMAFLLAFLMKKYQYDLKCVCRMFKQNIKCMNLPDIYTEQLKKISMEFEKERQDEEEELQLSGRIGKRIQRIRREYSNFSHWSRFGSLPKKTQTKFNPEIDSYKKPMTARNKIVEIQPMTTLPVSSRRKSIIEGVYDY